MSAIAEPKPSISGSFSHYPPDLPNTSDSHLTQDERRRRALRAIDEAGFSIFHVKACLVAGLGFFTCAYDIFAITIAETMIGFAYGENGKLSFGEQLGIKVSTQIGILIGQLLFGLLADMVGRKKMYGFELFVVILGTFIQALAGQGSAVNIIGILAFWRFIMGIGIGADYPLSAVITSEFAPTRVRGRMMTAVFATQGFGNFAASLVAYIITEAFKSRIVNGSSYADSLDYCWRLLIGLGAVPGCLALYFRLTIPETPRFTMDVERNVSQAAQDVNTFLTTGTYNIDPDAAIQRAIAPKASWKDFKRHFGQWKNFKVLFGAAYAWFALDVAFYGLSLNTPTMLSPIGFGPELSHLEVNGTTVYQTLRGRSRGSLILSVAGLIPGYWATFFFIDSWGRKPIQLMGFGVLTILFLCMGFGYDKMVGDSASDAARGAFVFLYCLANFFQNFGPNTTTFIVPGEAFPTRYRATAHGISAASGKLGAIISQVGCAYLKGSSGVEERDGSTRNILIGFGFFMLTGLLATFLIEETRGCTLEDLSNEAQDGFISGGAGPLEMQPEVVVEPYHRTSLGIDEYTEPSTHYQRVRTSG